MTVLSASICTRSGKPLLSRQYVEMNRLRVEGLLAAFPKLVGHAKEHTFVETNSVRYIYQVLEGQMYLLLITTKASNIVEDLGTLRLLAKVVHDVARSLQEHSINENAFELIFAFDEVLMTGGYKEEATLQSIRTCLDMESRQEQDYLERQKRKIDEARSIAQRKAKEISEAKIAQMRQSAFGSPPPMDLTKYSSAFEGFGSESERYDAYHGYKSQANKEPEQEPPKVLVPGMKLGGAGKKDSLMAAFAAESNLAITESGTSLFGLGSVPNQASAPSTPLTLALEEKISVSMNRDGGIEACEVKGTLTLTANTKAGAGAIVSVNKATLDSLSNWNFATNPKVNKSAFEKEGILTAKKGGFPLNRPVKILRWRYGGNDAAPITINCWPEDSGNDSINVSIEVELQREDMVLNDVNIVLPLGTKDPPVIEYIEGQYKHDPSAGALCWYFDVVDSKSSSGSLEFSVAGSNTDAFFPIQVTFKSVSLLCPIEVTSATSSSSGASIPNNMTRLLMTDSYRCA